MKHPPIDHALGESVAAFVTANIDNARGERRLEHVVAISYLTGLDHGVRLALEDPAVARRLLPAFTRGSGADEDPTILADDERYVAEIIARVEAVPA